MLCERSGETAKPWCEAGYSVTTVDVQPAEWTHPNRTHVMQDVRTFKPSGRYVFVCAFPPCTHLAVSGARWYREKGLSKLIEALEIVEACRRICEESGAPYFIENPIGTLATYWRDPDFMFHPVHYAGYAPDPEADGYTKKTCLWVGNGFVMPDRKPGEPTLGSMMHKLPPSDDRAYLRSKTPAGFARAVFEANRMTDLVQA